ncbi:hypothetical protein SLA2020_251510 [Shorea laevis]
MNQALLAKLSWKMLTDKSLFWVDLLHKKYCSDKDFLQVEPKNGISRTWRGILSTRSLVREGTGHLVRTGNITKFWKDHWISDAPLLHHALEPISEEHIDKRIVDYYRDGDWDWNQLNNMLPEEILYQLQLFYLEHDSSKDDECYWKESSNGEFTTSSAYNLLLKCVSSPIAGCWSNLWKVRAPPKTKTLLWLMLHNKVLTNVSRMAKGLTSDDSCPRCHIEREDVLHLFRDCPSSKQVWSKWLSEDQQRRWQQLSQAEWIQYNLHRTNVKIEYNLTWDAAFAIIIWYIWLGRNKAVFNNDPEWSATKQSTLMNHLMEAAYFLKKNSMLSPKLQRLVGWKPPPIGTFKINVDGSAQNSHGVSVAGGLCRDSQGNWQFGFHVQLGVGHAIRAEIYAILKALELAWQKGYRNIIIESDSLLAIHKINFGATHRDPYGNLVSRCRALLHRDWNCELQHIFREANNCADTMASRFYHLSKGWHFFEEPPGEVLQRLSEDLLGVCRPRASRLIST